jgi:hypothetical protein
VAPASVGSRALAAAELIAYALGGAGGRARQPHEGVVGGAIGGQADEMSDDVAQRRLERCRVPPERLEPPAGFDQDLRVAELAQYVDQARARNSARSSASGPASRPSRSNTGRSFARA